MASFIERQAPANRIACGITLVEFDLSMNITITN